MSSPLPLRGIRRRRSLAVAGALSIALFGAACGADEADAGPTVAALSDDTTAETTSDASPDSTDDADGDADSDAPEMTPEEAELAFSQCLEDRGIEDPFAGGDGEAIGDDDGEGLTGSALTFESDEDFEAFEAANEECGKILEDAFGDFELSPEQEAAFSDAEAAFNQCMSARGFDMAGDGAVEIDEGDFEQLEQAADECDSAFDELNAQFESEAEEG